MANTTKRNAVVIDWPSASHFTIEELSKKYPSVINITLRFRIKRALENKEIVVNGKVKPAIGRPRLVFAKANPTKEILDAASKVGVLPLVDETKTTSSVPVADVTAPATPKKKATKTVEAPITEASTVKV